MLEEVLSHSGGTIETSPSCPLRLPKVLFSFWNSNVVIEETLLTNSLISLASLPFMGTSSIKVEKMRTMQRFITMKSHIQFSMCIKHRTCSVGFYLRWQRKRSVKEINEFLCVFKMRRPEFVCPWHVWHDWWLSMCLKTYIIALTVLYWEVPLRLKL